MLPFLVLLSAVSLNAIAFKLLCSKRVDRVLSVSIFIAQLMWYTLPGVLMILSPRLLRDVSWASRVTRDDFYVAYVIESLCVLIVLCLFWHVAAGGLGRGRFCAPVAVLSDNGKYILLSLCAVTTLYFAMNETFDYSVRNAAAMAKGESRDFMMDQIFSFTRGILITYALLLFVEEEKTTMISIYAFSLLLCHATISAAAGARMYVFLPLVAFFVRSLKHGRVNSGVMLKKLVVVALIAVAAFPLLYAIEHSRQRAKGSINIAASASKIDTRTAMVMLMTKLDCFSKGRVLVENAGAGAAGCKPYIGSALVFIPRLILPSRPVAGSVDGTYAGTPSRLVPRTEGILSDVLNVGVAPVHIAIWHFGYVAGVLCFVFVGAGYLLLLNHLLTSEWTFVRVLAVYTLAIPTFTGIFVSPDTVVRNAVIVFGAIALMMLVKATYVAMRRASYMVKVSSPGRGVGLNEMASL